MRLCLRRPPATPAGVITWLESNGRWPGWVFCLGPVGMHGTPRPCMRPCLLLATRPRNTYVLGKTGGRLLMNLRGEQPFPNLCGSPEKKPHLRSCSNQRDRAATCGFVLVRAHRKLCKKIDTRGFASYQPAAKFGEISVLFCDEASHSRVYMQFPTRANRGGKPTSTQARRPRRDLDREGARMRVGACPSVGLLV